MFLIYRNHNTCSFLHDDKSVPIYDTLYNGYSYGEAVSILLNPDKSRLRTTNPESNCSFVVNLKSLEHPDDIRSDDCGHWLHKGRKSAQVTVWFQNSKVIRVKSTTNSTPPDENSKVFTLVRTYNSHDPHGDFKIIFFHNFGEFLIRCFVGCDTLPYVFLILDPLPDNR